MSDRVSRDLLREESMRLGACRREGWVSGGLAAARRACLPRAALVGSNRGGDEPRDGFDDLIGGEVALLECLPGWQVEQRSSGFTLLPVWAQRGEGLVD